MSSRIISAPVVYPERDGKPMGETDVHIGEILALLPMLRDRYRDDPNVYVGANMLCYYEEGVPSSCFCPDVFVVFGVPKEPPRHTFKLWEEAQPPTVIFEVSSKQSKLDDLGSKKVLYESLGVSEYFVYDPLREYLRPPLQGFKLQGEDYVEMESATDGNLVSQRLGLKIKLEQNGLALWDAKSDERLLRPSEEQQRRREAEAEVERLRREIEKLKKKSK
jgi:Uma2 family endonuclease